MSIRKRLTLWYASLLTFIIVAFSIIVFGMMRWVLINEIDKTLDETAALINKSRFVPLPGFEQPQRYGIDLLPLDVFRVSGVEVQVWLLADGEYHFVDSSVNLRDYKFPLDPGSLGAMQNVYHNVDLDGAEWRVRTSPILSQGRLVGSVQVAGSLQTVHQALRGLLVVIAASCAGAIVGAFLLSMWLAGRVVEPIKDITQAAAYIAGTKDLSTRLEWRGPMDELGKLNAVFNQMMARLEQMFSVQQRFVADISHELRTPLTGIRGNVEMIKRYGLDSDSIDAIHAEVERMSRLVNDLLLLARADYGSLQIDLYPLDLDTVVIEATQAGRSLASQRNVNMKLTDIEPLRVNGNADRIKQVLLNLIDNAVKFTPAGGTVSVSLTREGHNALLTIHDTGIGIAPDELQRIFDRFYQSDPARTHVGGGFGLGLSIAKWIVEAHQGTISVESQPNVGTCFSIRIPLYGVQIPRDTDGSHTRATKTRVAISRRPAGQRQTTSQP